jgi:predicted  nucleic acid-binding Zn-ribbon protein
MTDEQGGQPADQPERAGSGSGSAASDPAGGFFAAQEELTGRPAAELTAESAQRHAAARGGDPARPDPAAVVADSENQVRRCAFTRCRKPLPDKRRAGKKSEHCPQEVTSWEVEPGVVKTCGQMARSERDLAAVIRQQTGGDSDGPVAVPALDVVELGERIDTAIPAVQGVLGSVASLLEGLTSVRTTLDQDIAAAHAARDEAVRAKTIADSDAAAARQVAVAAEAAQADAEERAAAAESAARRDRDARIRAERAQATAEGRVTELQDNLQRADERIEALADRAERAATDLAHTEGELTAARAEVAAERARADAQEQRATNAVAAATELERTLRGEFAQDLARRTDQHQQALATARTDYDQRLDQRLEQARRDTDAALHQVREQSDAARAADRSAHDEQVGQLHQQLGALTQRAQSAETAQRAQAGQVRELRAALTGTLNALDEDSDALRQQIRQLLEEQ